MPIGSHTSRSLPPASLTSPTARPCAGVTGELSSGGDYPGAQAWAERLFQAGFGGIWYTAKHDPRGDLHSIALFGKPGLHEDAFVSTWSEPIGDDMVDEVEDRFGIQVLPSARM